MERARKAELSQAQVMEYFIRDLTYHASELLLIVVNHITLEDQKFITLIEGRSEGKGIVIVHNLRDVTSEEELHREWEVRLNLLMEYESDHHRLQPDVILKAPDIRSLCEKGWALDIPDKATREWIATGIEREGRSKERERKIREIQKEKESGPDVKKLVAQPTWRTLCHSSVLPESPASDSVALAAAGESFSVVGIMGYYNKGKTWVLNKLLDSNFRAISASTSQIEDSASASGLCFSIATSPSNTTWLLLDTIGYGSPLPS